MKINHEFLKNESLIKVFNALEKHMNNCALIVGGAVRNSILQLEVIDIDIATILTPHEIIKALKNADIRYIPTGIEHGTISALLGNKIFEITTLRKDVVTDGRHAIVNFTNDWLEDAKRRDFTINALYCDLMGNVHDPLNKGIDDIKNRKIEFVGDIKSRINEDYLRILRFFRFYSQLPNFSINNENIKIIAQYSNKLQNLSKERIWSEFKKICNGINYYNAFKIINENNILNTILEINNPNYDLEILAKNLSKISQDANEILILAKFINFENSNAENLQTSLRLSNQEKKQIIELNNCINFIKNDFGRKNLEIAKFNFGTNILKSAIISIYCGNDILNILNEINNFQEHIFPIDGKYLSQMGIMPSPKMGKIIEALKAKWFENNFTLEIEQIKEIVNKFNH